MTSLQKYVLSETNKVSVKLFNKITRITEVKTWVKHVLRDCKYKFDSAT